MSKADKIMQDIKNLVDKSGCMVVASVVADGEIRSTVYGNGSVDEIAMATEQAVHAANDQLTKIYNDHAPKGIGSAPKITHVIDSKYIH